MTHDTLDDDIEATLIADDPDSFMDLLGQFLKASRDVTLSDEGRAHILSEMLMARFFTVANAEEILGPIEYRFTSDDLDYIADFA